MNKETIEILAEKSTNSNNEIQPTIFTVKINGEILFQTTELKFVLQSFLNRIE